MLRYEVCVTIVEIREDQDGIELRETLQQSCHPHSYFNEAYEDYEEYVRCSGNTTE